MADSADNGRLDLWLKLCCVFKQRSEAAEACRGGLVKLNGSRAKPSATVKPGDVIEISGERQRKLVVQSIPHGSVSKEVARTMYLDQSPPPPPKAAFDPFTVPLMERERGSGRPTKRERRQIHRFTDVDPKGRR